MRLWEGKWHKLNTYLLYENIVAVMGLKAREVIMSRIKKAKYYSIMYIFSEAVKYICLQVRKSDVITR